MPRALASSLSLLFFLGTAAVLSIPIVISSDELVLQPQRFEGLVGETSHPTPTLDATLDEGAVNEQSWSIRIIERPGAICFSFRMGPEADRTGALVCTEPQHLGSRFGPSQFVPASGRFDRSVLVAVIPQKISLLRLKATDGLPLMGELYDLPSPFKTQAHVLIVFLAAGTDLTSAIATDDDGKRVDASRLVDQVDAY